MDKAGILAALSAAGLSALTAHIDQITQPAIRLFTAPAAESTLQIGTPKLGGLPDLPPGVSWPQWKGLPQSFIAQIRLDDARPYDPNKLLPAKGMLWFFYDAGQETYGDNPTDRGGWQVLFMDHDPDNLQRTPAPSTLPADSQFKACAISFAGEITISQQPQLEIPGLKWTDNDQEKYDDMLSTLAAPAEKAAPRHRLLGFPDTLQDDMRLQCQLVSHGITDENDARASALSRGTADWQLLFQVDSDEHAGMRWASTGILYYWITRADLQAGRFSDTWLVLQSE